MRRFERGDTIVEVLLAVAVFSLVAVGVLTVMNQGTNTAQRALEITLVRQQIDAQADTLRAIHQAYPASSALWNAVTAGDSGVINVNDTNTCPEASDMDGNMFALNPLTGEKLTGLWYQPMTAGTAPPFSQLATDAGILKSYGIWVEPKEVTGAGVSADVRKAYEFSIKACWFDVMNNKVPMQIHTIVRLYDPRT